MKLSVLISTIDTGINNVSKILLDTRNDVEYIISHQYRDEKFLLIPPELIRSDVIISQIPGKGLTISRNNAIRLANGDICVIADDDVIYTNEYFDTIKEAYSTSNFDLICLKIYTGEGQPQYKNYPNERKRITSILEYSPSSIEITFLKDPVIKKNILFDERFGMGSWLNGGGENLFVHDAIEKGLNVEFIPEYIVQHPFESTIKSFPIYAKRRVRVLGALDARLDGAISIPKAFYEVVRSFPKLIKNKKNPISYLMERLSGVAYILKKPIK